MYLPWNDIGPFDEKRLQLSHTDFQVRITELVRNIPSERAELHTLLHCCMEKAKTKQHLSPCWRFVVVDLVEKLWIIDRITRITLIIPHSLTRLVTVEFNMSLEALLSLLRKSFPAGTMLCIPGTYLNHVGSQSFGRLICHFDSILENRNWKLVRRVAGEPEPEHHIRRLRSELLADLLQRRHP